MQKQRGQQTWVQRERSFAHRLRIERTRPGHRSLIIYAQCEYTCLRLAGLLINWKRFIHANQLHEKKKQTKYHTNEFRSWNILLKLNKCW